MTSRHLEHICDRINDELVDYELRIQGRYGYFGLDLYNKTKESLTKTLITGTKKTLGIYLLGFEESVEFNRCCDRRKNG